uniref:F-box protein n=1 Tax=Meloidogyne javanica TaxID=6303 RepID=A0A915LW13_MELJA
TDLETLANCCPNLEHLDFSFENYLDEPLQLLEFKDFRQLRKLCLFKKLSSLSILMLLKNSFGNEVPFHECSLEDGGLKIEDFFLELLIKLNSITPLRALETFKCRILFDDLPYDEDFNEREFFSDIREIFNSNVLKVFRFVIKYDEDDVVLKWTTREKYTNYKIPYIPPLKDVNFCQSIVVKEIFNDLFGERNRKILFGPYRDSHRDFDRSYSSSFMSDE